MISEQLRVTLLSLKQISDRLKSLNTTSVTKSEALVYKNEIISALNDIDFAEITEALDSIDGKIDDISTELENVAQETTAQQTANKNEILAAIPTIPTDYAKAGSGTNVTNTDLKNLLNGISTSMYKGVPVVTPQGSGTQATPYVLQPNQWNQFSSVLSGGDIYFSKGTDIANITNCYMVRFELAANWSGTSVNFEGFSLEWNGGSVPTWTAGNTYEVNIVDNIAMWAEITPAS